MSKVKYYYIPYPHYDSLTGKKIGEIYRPMIPVRLGYKHNVTKFLIDCLIDSGSDFNLFPALWGEKAGIDTKKGRYNPIRGIGNNVIEAYSHNVTLFIGTRGVETRADFSYEQQVPLLGRGGFFNLFGDIIINEKARYVEFEIK